MESGRPAGESDAVGPVGDGRQLGFERIDLRSERGDPTTFEGTVDGGLVGQSSVGWGEIDATHRVAMRLTGSLAGPYRRRRRFGDGKLFSDAFRDGKCPHNETI